MAVPMSDVTDTARDAGIEQVLEYLRDARLFDFTGYKRGTLSRRIGRRMQTVGVADADAYVEYLEVHPDEFEQLFNTILINLSSFFRDPDAWDHLRSDALPAILSAKPGSPLRAWSAGCATGQEPYSIVMLVAEELGADAVKDRLKVYATDLDADALETARQAEYSEREVEGVPPELLEKYFRPVGSRYAFSPDLRRSVIFGRHDLLQDAPISRTDLLLCRNTLMYFNADVQAQLIQRLHFSLADDGFLMLGKVEMLADHDLFRAVDQKHRLFRKVSRSTLRERLLTMAARPGSPPAQVHNNVADIAFELLADAGILVDPDGVVIGVNARARELFGLRRDAVGRLFHDLELSYRPIELRSRLDQVRSERRSVCLEEVPRWTPGGDLTFMDIGIVPLLAGRHLLATAITFSDVTQNRRVRQELEETHRELEVAYEELQSTNEELETTNEELQSTVEELETTNEELQSTNEELETMNEELSSTNEELQAINDELRYRTSEVNEVNAYIESVLGTLDASVIVVDQSMAVRVWNGLSFEMWGLRADEAEGRNVLALDLGFPVDVLGPPIRACLQGEDPGRPFTVDAVSRRGHPIRCIVRTAQLRGAQQSIEGAIVLINEAPPS